jgi:hypothetical protein
MDSRLSEEVRRQVIAKDAIRLKKVRWPMGDPLEDAREAKSGVQPVDEYADLDLVPGRERSQQKQKPLLVNDKMVDYVRSSEAVRDRIEAGFKKDLGAAEMTNHELLEEVNSRLLELDHINEDRRSLSQALIDQIKFVRDLQGSLGTADNGEIRDVIDKEMEQQFKAEKQKNLELRELIRANKQEYDAALEHLSILLEQKDVTYVTKHGNQISLGRIAMTIDELIKYRETILRNCEDLSLELQNFSRE